MLFKVSLDQPVPDVKGDELRVCPAWERQLQLELKPLQMHSLLEYDTNVM